MASPTLVVIVHRVVGVLVVDVIVGGVDGDVVIVTLAADFSLLSV